MWSSTTETSYYSTASTQHGSVPNRSDPFKVIPFRIRRYTFLNIFSNTIMPVINNSIPNVLNTKKEPKQTVKERIHNKRFSHDFICNFSLPLTFLTFLYQDIGIALCAPVN